MSLGDSNSPKNLRFGDISQQFISDRLMQTINCLKTHLKIKVSKLNIINEFWYNRLVL